MSLSTLLKCFDTTSVRSIVTGSKQIANLVFSRNRLNSWDENYAAARNACEAWKKETAISTKKAELALKEKDMLMSKVAQLQQEVDGMSMNGGGPYLHAIKKVSELKSLPVAVLKAMEWQLNKDIIEVGKVRRQT